MEPLTAISLLMKFAPTIAGWIGGDKAEEKTGKAVALARQITGTPDGSSLEEAVERLERNPELAVRFREAILNYELEMERERTRQLEAVNRSMQSEAKSEHWPQYSWRPFNGFAFGTTLFFNYGIAPLAQLEVASVPEFVFVVWAGVLGVAMHHRGRAKREAATGEAPAKSKGLGEQVRELLGR